MRGTFTPRGALTAVDYWIEIRPLAFAWVAVVPLSFLVIAITLGGTGQLLVLMAWAAGLFVLFFVVVTVPTAFLSWVHAKSLGEMIRRELGARKYLGS